jgi:phage terminase small subunit
LDQPATKKKALSPKQATFVREYLVDLNATQAAIRAGYSPKTARVQASDLLTKPDIQEAVRAGQDKRAARLELKAEDVLRELQSIAMAEVDQSLRYEHKIKALELLGKHLKLFTEKIDLAGANGEPLSVTIVRKVSE